MISVDALVAQARQWVGVPFVHQGRSRYGCDCLGFVAGCLAEIGCPVGLDNLPGNYSRMPQTRLIQTLEAVSKRMVLQAGSLVVIQFPNVTFPSHAAIFTGQSLIHSYEAVGKVVEHGYAEPWIHRTDSVWALPQVGYE